MLYWTLIFPVLLTVVAFWLAKRPTRRGSSISTNNASLIGISLAFGALEVLFTRVLPAVVFTLLVWVVYFATMLVVVV